MGQMKFTEISKIRTECMDKINKMRREYKERYSSYSAAQNLFNLNQFHNKLSRSIHYSMITYLVLGCISGFVFKSSDISSLLGSFPITSFPAILSGSSLFIGFSIRKVKDSILKSKKAFKYMLGPVKVSESKKMLIEVTATIEKEVAKANCESFDHAISGVCDLKKPHNIESTFAKGYLKNTKSTLEYMKNDLDEENVKMRNLITKKVLYDYISGPDPKFTKKNVLTHTILSCITAELFLLMPIFLVINNISYSSLLMKMISDLLPLSVIGIATYNYQKKRNRDYEIVMENLVKTYQNELDVFDGEQESDLDKQIKDIILSYGDKFKLHLYQEIMFHNLDEFVNNNPESIVVKDTQFACVEGKQFACDKSENEPISGHVKKMKFPK